MLFSHRAKIVLLKHRFPPLLLLGYSTTKLKFGTKILAVMSSFSNLVKIDSTFPRIIFDLLFLPKRQVHSVSLVIHVALAITKHTPEIGIDSTFPIYVELLIYLKIVSYFRLKKGINKQSSSLICQKNSKKVTLASVHCIFVTIF